MTLRAADDDAGGAEATEREHSWCLNVLRVASQQGPSCLARLALELVSQTAEDLFGKKGWHRIAELSLHAQATANEVEVIRIREEPLDLRNTEPSVLPVKRTYVWAWLGLDRG